MKIKTSSVQKEPL